MGDPTLETLVREFLSKAKAASFETDRAAFVDELRTYRFEAAVPNALNKAARKRELCLLLNNAEEDKRRYAAELARLEG